MIIIGGRAVITVVLIPLKSEEKYSDAPDNLPPHFSNQSMNRELYHAPSTLFAIGQFSYSYSGYIFGLSTSCPRPPPEMQCAMP